MPDLFCPTDAINFAYSLRAAFAAAVARSAASLSVACAAAAFASSAAFASASATSASPAYPTFSDYAGKAYNVSYDQRALTLNGEHAFFLSGAVHPPRGTQDDWDSWFSSAKGARQSAA